MMKERMILVLFALILAMCLIPLFDALDTGLSKTSPDESTESRRNKDSQYTPVNQTDPEVKPGIDGKTSVNNSFEEKAEHEINISSIEGDQFTCYEGYQYALKMARGWDNNASLFLATSRMTSKNFTGKSTEWCYFFRY